MTALDYLTADPMIGVFLILAALAAVVAIRNLYQLYRLAPRRRAGLRIVISNPPGRRRRIVAFPTVSPDERNHAS